MTRWHEQASFGVGLRRPHFDAVLETLPPIDFFEILPENFMRFGGRPRRVLDAVATRYPLLSHGVALSIGGPDPLDDSYLETLRGLLDTLEVPFFSDHLSYSRAFGVEYHDLLPLPFTEDAVRHVARRVEAARERVGRPLALENPSYYFRHPSSTMGEAAFIGAVLEEADARLLLDVNNVYVNAQNHGYDPVAFIDALPLERVVEIHLAGHDASGPFIVDTHSTRVPEPVMDLYRYALAKVPPVPTLLEWDNAIPSLDVLVDELGRIRDAAHDVLAEVAA